MSDAAARLDFPATALAVRAALRTLCDGVLRALTEADRGTAQIVLAEALNNVVEHAYAGGGGRIALQVWIDPGCTRCVIADRGRAMVEGLPPGNAPNPADLPEGGFGWFLIRSLASDLRYSRIGGVNELSFRLPRRV